MIDIIMLLLIGSWFYRTAVERNQQKAVWVVAGLGGYLLAEVTVGWAISGFLVSIDPELWVLQTIVVVASGLLGALIARFVLLNLWKSRDRRFRTVTKGF